MTGDRPSSAQAVERLTMGRDELHPAGPAEEVQTPPASVPQSSSGSAPSRRLLQRRLAQQTAVALARAGRRSTLAAVIFLDLDGFKQINDALGHAAGDELLMRIAERLRPAVRPADTL